MTATDVAQARQDRLTAVGDQAASSVVQLWQRGMGDNFDSSWTTVGPQITDRVAAAQVLAAAGSTRYVNAAASLDDLSGDAEVEPAAFAGIDGSGRPLESLLYGAVTTAKTAIGRGLGLQSALNQGSAYLATMAKTSTADIGRASDLTAATAKTYVHYVRVVSPGACSRCAILAGISSYKVAFKRHPACRCTAMPITTLDNSPARLFSSPDDYFQTLTAQEQDRIFTKAGADAIRAGADPIAVVTARRGAPGIDYGRTTQKPGTVRRLERRRIGTDKAGNPIFGYVTGEGTTRRGDFTKMSHIASGTWDKRVRLMPETIVALTDDTHLRRVLLRDAGYLRYPYSGTDWIARRTALIRSDRAEADAFYRSRGIRL